MVGLFGGAFQIDVPEDFVDIRCFIFSFIKVYHRATTSQFRDVPDNQEVFACADTDQSIQIEIAEPPPGISDDQVAQWYFNALVADSDAANPQILDIGQVRAQALPTVGCECHSGNVDDRWIIFFVALELKVLPYFSRAPWKLAKDANPPAPPTSFRCDIFSPPTLHRYFFVILIPADISARPSPACGGQRCAAHCARAPSFCAQLVKCPLSHVHCRRSPASCRTCALLLSRALAGHLSSLTRCRRLYLCLPSLLCPLLILVLLMLLQGHSDSRHRGHQVNFSSGGWRVRACVNHNRRQTRVRWQLAPVGTVLRLEPVEVVHLIPQIARGVQLGRLK